jgi:uncharacterized protein YndB with AHSA1/START domain
MKDITYVTYIGAPPEAVWKALVGEEGVKAVFFGCRLESTFRPGDDYAYVGPGPDGERTVHVYGKILEIEANRLLRYTEHPGPSYRENHAELETRITYTLEPIGEGTRLTLVHDRWPDNHPGYAQTVEAWPMMLSNLKSFVEAGRAFRFG